MSCFFNFTRARPQWVLRIFLLSCLLLSTASTIRASAAAFTDGTSGGASGKAFLTPCEKGTEGNAALLTTELGGCQRKLVVDLTLDDNTVAGTILETGVAISTALDQSVFSEAKRNASDTAAMATTLQVTMPPIRVDFRRGGVQMRYRLSFLREFPGALRDYVQTLRTAMMCDDEVTRCPSYTPLSSSGKTSVVVKPLGVCCLCTSVDCAISDGLCNASMRTDFCFRSAAAGSICVREEGVRYGGWSIGVGSPYYALNTSVSGSGIPSTSFPLTTDKTSVQIGTSSMQLLQVSGVNNAVAQLRVNMSQRVLFSPLSGDRATAGASEWLLVPTSLVSAGGNDCDKVGTTPEYFYSLPWASQCNAQKGACLGNQLEDIRTADLARIAQGRGGSYLAAYLGSFTQDTIGAQRYLLDKVERSGGATLRWSTNADAISFTPVPVSGSLHTVFYAVGRAHISVSVSNSGLYAGLYYVSVSNCTSSTVQAIGGGSGDGISHEFVASVVVRGKNVTAVLFSTWSAADAVGGVASCSVVLRDAVNTTLGSANVSWTVEAAASPTESFPTKAQRCQFCAFHDLRCLFSGVCEWQMLVWTLVALVVTWCPYVMLVYWRLVWKLCKQCHHACA
ncbi:hypothetical protein ABL78_3638 [Leptomonas seymouri]|uniref:Generative cell specific-1/HAP2 domain-containing protein n=1 Tax=Leptomonas seymouri TaxID=5684 RepID=A0A0N1I7I3_LEPSE|nr:hypothetical protein ABL78_3638 [Leptomonas seymouri]|eukprot:KPI87301.1 hypothetical protein ABL78_3638 [Leptomonas seymouri]